MIRKYRKSIALCLKASTLLVSLSSGYGRALAGTCTGSGGSYICSGAAAIPAGSDNTAAVGANSPLTVTTSPGFGINTSLKSLYTYGVSLKTSNGNVSFTDTNKSTIVGRWYGIYATTGHGDIKINTNGSVTGVGSSAVYAIAKNGNVTVTTSGPIVGGANGWYGADIVAKAKLNGSITITSTGTITGGRQGIVAYTQRLAFHNYLGSNNKDITISAANVYGSSTGIDATNVGSGTLSITSSGNVRGAGGGGYGIYAQNFGTTTAISVAGDVSGTHGITAKNWGYGGKGDLSVKVNGIVSGDGRDAIFAINKSDNLTIVVGGSSSRSYGDGIRAYNYGTGALSITASGLVSGATVGKYVRYYSGIEALNGGTNLVISSTDVTGGNYGISARNKGTGYLSVTSTGTISGSTGNGVNLYNSPSGTDLTGSFVNVSGGTDGISAVNKGTGSVSLTSTGLVTGTSGSGIYAYNSSKGINLAVSAASVSGGDNGIEALNNGTGALTITTTGAVTGGADAGNQLGKFTGIGIWAQNNGTNLTISTADVTGTSGIAATQMGSGALSITTAGAVTGNTGAGIYANNSGGSLGVITINSSSVVQGSQEGILIRSPAGQPTILNISGQVSNSSGLSTATAISAGSTWVKLLAGSTTTGNVVFNSGVNGINFLGGAFNGNISFTGNNESLYVRGITSAAPSQVLHLDGNALSTGSSLYLSGDQYQGGTFAMDNANEGINLSNWDSINFVNGTKWTLTGGLTLKDPTVVIDSTSTLYAGNGVMPVISGALPVNFMNAGTVDLTNGGFTAQNKLTIDGNYIGQNGVLKVNTVLGPGASTSDKLVINGGSATGTTLIQVNPVGAGTATTGDGVQVISAINGATIAPGAFTLAQPVRSGAYWYNLYQGGPDAIDAYGDSSTYDYYLRSVSISASAQLYRAVPATVLNLGMETLGTLQERTGSQIWDGQQTTGNGVWARVGGSASSFNPSNGTSYTQDNGFVQGGYDHTVVKNTDGRTVVGFFGTYSYGNSKMDIGVNPATFMAQSGNIRTSGYGLGSHLTWLGTGGGYVDGVVQATFYNSDISSSDLSQDVTGNRGLGEAVSVEGGQRITINKTWAVVPQAQLIYSSVNLNGITDSLRSNVTNLDGNSLVGRVGARLEWLPDNPTHHTQAYVIANLNHDFVAGSHVTVDSTTFKQENDPVWSEIGLGLSYNITDNWKVFGEASYNTSLSHVDDSYVAKGVMGISAAF